MSTRTRATSTERRALAPWLPVIAVGVGILLGALAIAIDEASVPGGRLLVVVFSSGAAWGGAAVALGAIARNRLTAAVAGAVVVVAAVLAYYGGYQATGLRDATGSSLSRAALIWGVIALPGGAVAGFLGWHARSGRGPQRSVAWGCLAGLLLGQGVAWAWRYGFQPDVVFTSALVVPIAVLAWGVRHGGAAIAVPTAVVTAVSAAAIWSAIGRMV